MTDDPVRELVARQQISDLIHEYCVRVDRYEPEAVAELFFEDSIVDYGPTLGGPEVGRAPLAAKLRSGLGQFEATHHQVSNIQLRFTSPDRATGISYVRAWHKGRGKAPDFVVYGQYHDVFERRQGHWAFARRTILVAGHNGPPIDWIPTPRARPE